MYKSGHTKSKSDTDFFSNKMIADEISGIICRYDNPQPKEVNFRKIKKQKSLQKKITNSWQRRKNSFMYIFLKILLFKKHLDYYFFDKKIPLIKLDLDNILMIINKKLEELKSKLISECPILSKSVLIEKLNEFNEIILSLIETRPQEFYKQVKLVILSHLEQIRLEIFELLENLCVHPQNNNPINFLDANKIKKDVTFNHGILFNYLVSMNDAENYYENDFEVHLTSEIKENIISVILPRKKKILQIIEDISHELLFSMTKFSYAMEYYSVSISDLVLRIMKHIDTYLKQKNILIKNKENKILFLIELIFKLNVTFNQRTNIDFKNVQNMIGNFILNNLFELIPKSHLFDVFSSFSTLNDHNKNILIGGNKLYSEKLLVRSLFIRSQQSNLFYNYSTKFSQKKNKFKLIRPFQLYYDLKLIFWKSIYTKIETDLKDSNICCRICEQKIPLNDFVLHVFYCKEQNHYYKDMTKYKNKIKEAIKELEIYREKINLEINSNKNSFVKKNIELNNIIKEIKKNNRLIYLDENNTDDFFNILIKIYINEKEKQNDYYEIYPEKFSHLGHVLYLTFFVYVYNKRYLEEDEFEDFELSIILINFISYFLKMWKKTSFFLEARHLRTKSNRYLNNNQNSFHSNDLGNFQNNLDFSKKLNYLEINEENELKGNSKRRNTLKQQRFSRKMELFKNQFSFNKKQKSKNCNEEKSNNYSSLNGDSSHSNIDKNKEITIVDMKAKSTQIDETYFDKNRLSGNFKLVKKDSKITKINNKNNSKNKNKIIKYIRNELKELEKNQEESVNINKSSKIVFNNQLSEKINMDENMSFFTKKESSIIDDDNSLSFFSLDKKSIMESQSLSNSFANSEKENNKNDFILNANHEVKFYLSSKINNNRANLNAKDSGTFLKNDVQILKHNSNRRQSLFKSYNNEEENKKILNKIKQKKLIKDSEFLNKRKNTFEKYMTKNNEIKKLKYLGKINNNNRRGSSPDLPKDKLKLLDAGKNLVLIDNVISESSSSENSNRKHNTKKLLKIKSSSDISSDIIENKQEETKKDEQDEQESNSEESISIKNGGCRNIFDHKEIEKDLFSFDSDFFINSEINSNNKNLINILKNLLIELNNEVKSKEDEENNKSFNNSILKSTDSGTKFSNFKLILPIAKGGYGTVGLYKKISTGDLYTIKSVDINKMKERKLSKTLQNERNIMKEISSDYVVTTYYLFKDKINYYFVMEYLPGGDVYKLLSSIFLPFSTIQLIVAETVLAVNYLHNKNIIHHDIKPENILITKNGHFKLSDFGLSKTINKKGKNKLIDEEHLNSKSSEGSSNSSLMDSDHDDTKIEGTLFYMSPELFTGDYPVGKSIDYWAIGIIIFELFTFKVPFEANTQEETRQNIINYNINWDPMYSDEVQKHYQDYIDSAVDLIKKFIFFNPSQRWSDNDLDKIKNHEFFKGFDWANIKSIKSTAVIAYLKKIVEENNKKIKEYNKGNIGENYAHITCEENLTYNEENNRFSQRIDNLQKRNNELIKMKFKKKEIKIEENDTNSKRSLFFDLQ